MYHTKYNMCQESTYSKFCFSLEPDSSLKLLPVYVHYADAAQQLTLVTRGTMYHELYVCSVFMGFPFLSLHLRFILMAQRMASFVCTYSSIIDLRETTQITSRQILEQ